MLASYAYENNTNGRLAQMAYGNGDTVNYTYDLFDRKTAETYNDGTSYHYEYDAEGSLAGQYATDANGATTEQYSYEYDSLGRLIHSKELDGSGNMVQRTEHLYDTSNRVRAQNWMFANGASFGQKYTYDAADDTLKKIETTTPLTGFNPSVTYTYTPLRQIERKTTDNLFYRAYAYHTIGSERKTAQVEFMNYRKPDGDALILGYQYMYDAMGNISAVYKSKASGGVESAAAQAYTYDALGQLTAVTDNDTGHTYSYTYDTAGNIRSATASGQNGVNKTFSYDNASWPDLLTSVTVGGTTKSIEYQTSESGNLTGNPITYYNGTDYTFGWGKGTQLTSATVGDTEISYAYDMSGVRSSKTVGGTTYTYTTLSGLVMQQTDGTQELYFLYDDSNQPYALVYKSSATAKPSFYYYMLNVQGDVVALMGSSGTIVARYSYDPWGVPTVKNASGAVMTSSSFIGNVNPLRYRGYYYDTETGFYYLQSRYYDPAIGRFISADKFASTGQGFIGCNMFAYCGNNPVNYSDVTGLLAAEAAITLTNWWNPVGWLTATVVVIEVVAIVALSYGTVKNVLQVGKGSSRSSNSKALDATTPASPQPPKNNKQNDSRKNSRSSLKKLTEYQLKNNGLDAHSIKYEYLGRRAKISRYDLAYDTRSHIIYIIDKAGKVIVRTAYRL